MNKIAIILTLPIDYDTSSMIRCRSIINGFIANNNTVTCYCPYPDTKSKYFSKNYKIPNNINVIRYAKTNITNIKNCVTNKSTNKKSFISKILNIFYRLYKKIDIFGSTISYLPECSRISNSIKANKFNTLISFSDPMTSHMIGSYCKFFNRPIRYIQQWGDPLATDKIAKIALPFPIRKFLEFLLVKFANTVCYVSPFTLEEQKQLFKKQKNKMIFLPTPFVHYATDKRISETNNISIGYFGSYNSIARDLTPFYQAAKRCKTVNFYIIGDSDKKFENTENIHIIPRLAQKELQEYFNRVDILVCLMNKKGNQIPGKVYHDAGTMKDILFIKDGEFGNKIEEYFNKFKHYTFVDNNVESIQKAIMSYVTNGIPRREPIIEFSEHIIARKILDYNK